MWELAKSCAHKWPESGTFLSLFQGCGGFPPPSHLLIRVSSPGLTLPSSPNPSTSFALTTLGRPVWVMLIGLDTCTGVDGSSTTSGSDLPRETAADVPGRVLWLLTLSGLGENFAASLLLIWSLLVSIYVRSELFSMAETLVLTACSDGSAWRPASLEPEEKDAPLLVG